MCVSFGLKNPGDFTLSEGHGYSLVSYIITTMCLSVASDDGSAFEWTGKTVPDSRILRTGTGPDSRIPKPVAVRKL